MLARLTASWYAATERASRSSVSDSFWCATSAVETSPNALVTVDSYCDFASSKRARLASYWFLSAMPWKSGPVRPAVKGQVLPDGRRLERSELTPPYDPVRLIVGKKLARAAPTFALAETSCCSACRTSGRRSSSAEGRPAGTCGGTFCSVRLAPRAMGPGFRPRRKQRRFSCAT